jgi:hypothetical protein
MLEVKKNVRSIYFIPCYLQVKFKGDIDKKLTSFESVFFSTSSLHEDFWNREVINIS